MAETAGDALQHRDGRRVTSGPTPSPGRAQDVKTHALLTPRSGLDDWRGQIVAAPSCGPGHQDAGPVRLGHRFLRLAGLDPRHLGDLLVGDALLPVGEGDEAVVDAVELRRRSSAKPRSSHRLRRACRPLCLPSTSRLSGTPTDGRVDDLVRRALLQEPVLVDAGLVREGVPADDRLVGLRAERDQAAQQLAGRIEVLGADRR